MQTTDKQEIDTQETNQNMNMDMNISDEMISQVICFYNYLSILSFPVKKKRKSLIVPFAKQLQPN